MTLLQFQNILRDRVRQTALDAFNVELDQIASETPPKTELGDLAFPVAFELAKLLKQQTGEKKNPREIAEILKQALEEFDFVAKVEVAGAGYLNIFFERAKFLSENADASPLPGLLISVGGNSQKVCVEHTSVNPNKAAHIGHVRNAVLGDTFMRILRATSKEVEVQYYIDNTGVQVADVVIGFVNLKGMGLAEIRELDAQLLHQEKTFDYFCWDLYAEVGREYQSNEELKARRSEVLNLIEEGNNPTAELADYIVMRNVQCIVNTMERISIRYDLLPRESEILHLQFWSKAFEQMKSLGVLRLETEGKNAGCWVMPFESHSGNDEHESDKILVRSNGTVTYTGKDIAYQMWKLGILGMDFFYKRFHTYEDGQEVWITSANVAEDEQPRPQFGGGETVYNVIDSRQSYPQDVVKKGVAAIVPEKGESASIHLSYEMVALSPAAAVELGFKLSDEDKKRPFIEMSGRKGLGVKADDLITRLETNALSEVESRHTELPLEEKQFIAHQLAVGALRYFLLKFTRNTIIVFDFKEALSTEGETGAFCQYSAVRANSIFRKLDERDESLDDFLKHVKQAAKTSDIFSSEHGNEIWSVITLASRLEETVHQSAAQNEPAILAKYAFNLAKAFNLFYHHHKIIAEENADKRAVLVATVDIARRSLTAALNTMGIAVPDRM